jgi:hypothetical protein
MSLEITSEMFVVHILTRIDVQVIETIEVSITKTESQCQRMRRVYLLKCGQRHFTPKSFPRLISDRMVRHKSPPCDQLELTLPPIALNQQLDQRKANSVGEEAGLGKGCEIGHVKEGEHRKPESFRCLLFIPTGDLPPWESPYFLRNAARRPKNVVNASIHSPHAEASEESGGNERFNMTESTKENTAVAIGIA